MPEHKIPLEPDKFYHIYNRGINGCPIFKETTNYEHFLNLYDKHISPVADTFAWVLMGNHFHLLVRIKNPQGFENLKNPQGFENLEGLAVIKRINQQFSNLFNAYTKAFNKKYKRTGSLFEHTFERKQIVDGNYLKQIVLYIHNNPVHHGFCEHPVEYSWSSFLTCISVKPTKLHREHVLGWFDNKANFLTRHSGIIEFDKIERWLEL
jgi:REP element-mobilizing transposase RayT